MIDKVAIRRLPTGVSGFDAVIGGGVPEFSFNLIAGAPGTGKTTLVQQIMFALATPEHPALFFTVLGEPPIKMLRYQQQFAFFDIARVNDAVRFITLAEEVAAGGFDDVLRRIAREVEAASPGVVVVDSFRSVMQSVGSRNGRMALQHFVQALGVQLTGWQATTFLVGEFQPADAEDHPVFTVADGLVWLYQSVERNSMVRKLQVMKMRGQASIPGLHTFRITAEGLQVFPRLIVETPEARPVDGLARPAARSRLSTGVPDLDALLGGGVPAGHSVLVAGPSGSGKTVLATQFILEGARRGEPGVVAVFEKRPSEFAQVGAVEQAVRDGLIEILHTRPLDLSIDETMHELGEAIRRLGARRVVIDSLSGFELALAPTFREEFRESLYRMVTVLTAMDVTVMMTTELADSYTDLRFSPHGTAFLTDAIILQRYVEVDGQLRRALAVVKVRGSDHSKDLHLFDVTADGLAIGPPVGRSRGLLTGRPTLAPPGPRRGRRPEGSPPRRA